MAIDTRSEAERRYDATRLSRPAYIDMPPPSRLDGMLDTDPIFAAAWSKMSEGGRAFLRQLDTTLERLPEARQIEAENVIGVMCGEIERAQAPATPIALEEWHGEDGETYTDFTIGSGLTRVLLGNYDGKKPGIELLIGETCLNERLVEVITLADVQTLRDNLNALLADPRVQKLLAAPGA